MKSLVLNIYIYTFLSILYACYVEYDVNDCSVQEVMAPQSKEAEFQVRQERLRFQRKQS